MADLELGQSPVKADVGTVNIGNMPLRIDEFEGMMSGPARAVCGIFMRQLTDIMDGRVDAPDLDPDDSLKVLESLVGKFAKGESLSAIKPEVDRLVMAQDDRVMLVKAVMATHGLTRLVRLVKARDRLERFMVSCLERGDMTASEAIVFMKIIQTSMTEVQTEIIPQPLKDSDGVVDKADFATRKSGEVVRRNLGNTSPQGREVMRKMLYGMFKGHQNGQDADAGRSGALPPVATN